MSKISEKLLEKRNKIYINYLYYTYLIKTKVHGFIKRIHEGLKTIQIKLTFFKWWINRGFEHIDDFIIDIRLSLGLWLETHRYNKIEKFETKIIKLNKKIGNL